MSEPSMADDVNAEPPAPESESALTLRDRFALAVLPTLMNIFKDEVQYDDVTHYDLASDAYSIADAMLNVRAEPGGAAE